ncbi:indole-3-acetaldehyde oxidase-like [Penaeus japonicus]|uniref:indole-3-acetaldehyde oxidase-like n=1 Tax=Penaeus japonicus TaxID=27405 RepID=UPI001C7143B1|nr:indole-3-acetaldehyde oxidase-like [Penaeus japonicus]XP_042871767.1 indole-3-acetaldehyde oxidase-like [Penaeus japonicus]
MAPQETAAAGEGGVAPPRRLKVKINNKYYTIGPEVSKTMTLVDFLREQVKLPGTKVLCREGGCGVCTVVATAPDPEHEGAYKTFSVNACQLLVYACAGWSFETVEYLGNRYDGYHTLQKALTGFYGTQCGYCSPGMIMTMYGQLKSSGSLTAAQVEESLDGNLCRCTGYRPILDAFKSLAEDGDQCLKDKLVDIEEANRARCPKTGNACKGKCESSKKEDESSCKNGQGNQADADPIEEEVAFTDGGIQWYRPLTLVGVRNAMKKIQRDEKYCIVVGNTGQGVYKEDGPYTTYISTNAVKALYNISVGEPLVLGANVSLSRAIEVFQHVANTYPNYRYLDTLVRHWKLVANVSVRNTGSWAGNLMLKHKHHEFPSDIFLTLLAVDAQLTLIHADTTDTLQVDLETFLTTDMSRRLITAVTLSPMAQDTQFRTYKITPRTVNAHAYVNACFKIRVDPEDGFKVIGNPTIVYGGINPDFIHAKQTESFLRGRSLLQVPTIVKAARLLGKEVKPDAQPQDASPQYRKSLAQNLLYKAIVSILGDKVSNEIVSGGTMLERPLSSGQQEFDMNRDMWPVGKAIPKVESATQISGEAVYMDDIPTLPGELHGAFVQTKYAKAKLKSADASEALRIPGVVAYINASDIPGKNSFYPGGGPDPVFIDEQVRYAGQAVGLIVANDRETAVRAAKLVNVEYEDIAKPALTIVEALQEGREEVAVNIMTGKREPHSLGDVEEGFKEVKHKLKGELQQGSQFHLTMEAIAARVVPTEDGYDVFSTTQWPTQTQSSVAEVLDIPAHCINVSVRRIGGGYGGKITRQHVVSSAAAVASRKLRCPVRIVVDLNTHMSLVGWREPYLSKYEVGFDDDGKLQALRVDMFSDAGHVPNEASVGFLAGPVQNAYHVPNLLFRPVIVRTDTAANTWCRTPGTVEALATIENILEHIANYLKKDPLEVRMLNMVKPEVPRLMAPPLERNVVLDEILPLLKQKAMYEQRKEEVEAFNKANRWKKRGLSIVPLWYGFNYPSMFRYGIQVSIYEHDGTVAVTHGGIEMGQGINTKVAQVAAHALEIPIEKVIIKASDTTVGANSIVTGGSFGTDICCHGTKIACEALRQRIDAIKEEELKKDANKELTWEELIRMCHMRDVDLCERYWTAGKEHPQRYDIWAACCLEVEIDVLTGQYLLHRADIVEDCGKSMNPFVDIGQVEGAFIMGVGLYTSELVKFNVETGEKLSNGTWEYKPPTALDIPVDMRVTLLPNASNPYGVLGSKATGEPALCFSYVVVTALRQAIAAFRAENGNEDWFDMHTPLTVEKVQQLCGVRPEQFRLVSNLEGETCPEDFQMIDGDEVADAVESDANEASCSMT